MIRRRMAIGVVGALVVMLVASFVLLRGNSQPERPLLIWTGRGVSELTAIGHEFTARTGRAVQIESPANFVEKFEILAQQGQGPDIIIWAHDRFGAWQHAGLLLPLHPSADLQQHCLAQAMAPLQQADSSLLGYPLQLESLVLFWNRQLLAAAPTDVSQFPQLASGLAKDMDKDVGKDVDLVGWDFSSPYHSWPFVTAGVAKALQVDAAGQLRMQAQTAQTTLNLQEMKHWVEAGWSPKGLSYELALDRFSQNKLALMVGGPWDASRLQQSGVDYGVAALPAMQGRPVQPFYGVMAAGISAQSTEPMLAQEFLQQDLLTPAGMARYQSGADSGIVACYGDHSANPMHGAILQSVRQGVAMPGHPAMPLFWNSVTSALNNIFSERQTPQQALLEAQRRVNTP
ncbi:MAG: extracellular solute-binding protein [Aeromonadaceae bacterium]|nr:extracellular solute-binding protein [Aeromonadaceae bacterium]